MHTYKSRLDHRKLDAMDLPSIYFRTREMTMVKLVLAIKAMANDSVLQKDRNSKESGRSKSGRK